MQARGRNLKDRGKFALSPKRWWHAAAGVLIGTLAAWSAGRTGHDNALATWWTNGIDPFITSATLVVAVLLSVSAASKAWEEGLPKRLDVHCTFQGRYVATCWEATLAHEGDIRQWGQQIGRQMLGGANLKFTVTPVFHDPVLRNDDTGKRRVYTIEIALTEDPRKDGTYLVWDPLTDRQLYSRHRPTQPLDPSSSALIIGQPSSPERRKRVRRRPGHRSRTPGDWASPDRGANIMRPIVNMHGSAVR